MKYAKRNAYTYKIKQSILIYLMIAMLLGSILGALFSCFINENNIIKLNSFLDLFINDTSNDFNYSLLYFLEITFKGIKYFLCIWFLGFIPFGDMFIYIIVFSKGFFTSFTTALFFNKYYFNGIKYSFNIYFIENIFIILFIFYISYNAINYCKNKSNNIQFSIKNYILYIILCIILHVILCGIIYNI